MKYKLYADTHIGSPIEILRDEVMHEPYSETTFLLGDIIDGANCKKEDVETYRKMMHSLRTKHNGNYISGNHERATVVNETIIRDRVMFAHGDLDANPEKWSDYRRKPWGAGFFKRKFVVPFIREAEEIINRKPREDFLRRASSLARDNDCHTYICGHFHPKEMVEDYHNGVKIILLPRGITELEL